MVRDDETKPEHSGTAVEGIGEPAGSPDVPIEEAAGRKEPPGGPSLFMVHFEQFSANLGQTLTLAEALRGEDWDVHIVCRESCRLAVQARERSLPVHTLPDEAGKGFWTAWGLMRTIRKNAWKPEKGARKQVGDRKILVHACDVAASHLVSGVWRLDKKLRIAHTRRVPIMEAKSKAVRCYQVPPAKIITDSLAGKIALRLSGLEPHLLHIIPCGVEPSEQPVRRGRKDGRVVFAVLGDLVPQSGHSLLFEAMAGLETMEGVPPWEVRVLGDGPQFHELLEEAQTRKIDGRLAFLGGEDLGEKLVDCDVLILPAGEGESHIPLVLRGWVAGVPVIAINRLDHAESFQEDVNVALVPPGDAASLAQQMVRLAGDRSLRANLAEGGRASAGKFTTQAMILEHKRLYGQILA